MSPPPINLAKSSIENFVHQNPNDEDVITVTRLIEEIGEGSATEVRVPFVPNQLTNLYVAWTHDGKWRIIFRRRNGVVEVLEIGRER